MASSRVWVVVVMGFVGTIGSDSVDVDDCVLSLKSPPIDTNFHLTTRVANHRPVYADGEGRYLYHTMAAGKIGRWIVGDVVGSLTAWMYVDSFAPNPNLIQQLSPKARWLKHGSDGVDGDGDGDADVDADGDADADGDGHADAHAAFYATDDISLYSTCNEFDGGIFMDTDVKPDLAGFYSRTGLRTQDGRFVYVQANHKVEPRFLFSVKRSRWMLGADPNSSAGWMYVDSSSSSPSLIEEELRWMVGLGGDQGWQRLDAGAVHIITSNHHANGLVSAMVHWRTLKPNDNSNPSFTLRNGVRIPRMGFGTGALHPNEQVQAIESAIDSGYRLLDSASAYNNEHIIGDILRRRSARRHVFVTTKVWPTDLGFNETLQSFHTSLENLKTSYIDLYMIHWPFCYPDIAWMNCHRSSNGVWEDSYLAMEMLYAEGRILSLGVSNFDRRLLGVAFERSGVGPHVVQNFLDIFHPDTLARGYCEEKGIFYQLFSGLRSLNNDKLHRLMFEILEVLVELSPVHITPHALLLTFYKNLPSLRNDERVPIGVLARSGNALHIKDNLRVFLTYEMQPEIWESLVAVWKLTTIGLQEGQLEKELDQQLQKLKLRSQSRQSLGGSGLKRLKDDL
ncbi:hypothetical protein AAMO2058_001377900 [Amorphochlora amoebiformis]